MARNFQGRTEPNRKNAHRINGEIKTDSIRLIGAAGEQVGVVSVAEALSMAAQASLDLVEISPQAEPPVCKILDYGKFKFQEQKRTQEAKKKQQIITVKEITLRPGTEEHDYQVKLKKVRQFLERGDKVKVTVRFRGRELAHKEIGGQQLNRFIEDVCDIGHVDGTPNMLGRMMSMMMSPGADKEKLKAKLDREKEAAEE